MTLAFPGRHGARARISARIVALRHIDWMTFQAFLLCVSTRAEQQPQPWWPHPAEPVRVLCRPHSILEAASVISLLSTHRKPVRLLADRSSSSARDSTSTEYWRRGGPRSL